MARTHIQRVATQPKADSKPQNAGTKGGPRILYPRAFTIAISALSQNATDGPRPHSLAPGAAKTPSPSPKSSSGNGVNVVKVRAESPVPPKSPPSLKVEEATITSAGSAIIAPDATKEAAAPAPVSSDSNGTKVKLTDGKILEDAAPSTAALACEATVKVVARSPSQRRSTSGAKGATRRLASFEAVKYSSIVDPPRKDGGRIRYSTSFILALGAQSKKAADGWRPDSLAPFHEIFEEGKTASQRPSTGAAHKPAASGWVSRTLWQQNTAGVPGGRASTSEQRFQQSSYCRGFTGIMPTVPAPPIARSSLGPRGSSGTGLNVMGSQSGQQQSRSSVGGRSAFDTRGGRQPPRSSPPAPPPGPAASLARSANAWMPHNLVPEKRRGAAAEPAVDPEVTKILRKIKSLLNKLTLEKFESLSAQVRDAGIANRVILEGVIDLIFEKALDEPNFCALYSRLCSFLHRELPKKESWLTSDPRPNAFRWTLLNKCQKEFQSGASWAKEEDAAKSVRKNVDKMTSAEKEAFAQAQYERDKLKRRTLGNIRFVGELFKQTLITEKIINECIRQLLRNHNDPVEEETESLCKLLATVGKQLDQPSARKFMDACFNQLPKLAADTRLSSRIRFMVQDIIDMRKNGWQARQETAGPKLLAQIREEAKRKEQAADAGRHRQSLSRGGCRQGSSGAARLPTMGEQLGRPSRGTKPEICDHSKFGSAPSAMKRDTDPATVRLGPGTGMATGNYQFLRTAKGWKIVRRGSEPAGPRAMDDALPPA
ncbi:hypothetical protein SeLEV6574_g07593, partial [Synchytrium endobioticum]